MKIYKWFVIAIYSLMILGNTIAIWKSNDENELKNALMANLLLVLPIIYMLGDKI